MCVICEGPAVRYACTFNDSTAQPGDSRLRLLCITELAKAGGHASCAVDRTAQGACGGTVKVLALPDGGLPPALQPPAAANALPTTATGTPAAQLPATPQPTAGAEPAHSDAPPKTVQEMIAKGTVSASKSLEKTGEVAAESAKSTGTAIESAGTAVGNAAKKTWNCITSLFGDC